MPKRRQQFIPNLDANRIIRSAKQICKAILDLNIPNQQKKPFLSRAIWLITEAHGKYKTRYTSVRAMNCPTKKLRHEHVWPRKVLIQEMLDQPRRFKSILRRAIGCTVTIAENAKLNRVSRKNPHLKGWERYRTAGIKWLRLSRNRCP